ncbi:hypothetical protein GHT06_005344 [Daphnia sinensis]|uniref:Uncharacterized protein n=1 Tax=Daphnia sinensis TaxID=1820382 RepID=A0AAD5KV40_9CRUS|nr:hypothetical protein GHT06_005344 [Daphnia sinensis]
MGDDKICVICNDGFTGRIIQYVSCVECKGPVHLSCIPGNKRGKVLSKATYVLMNKNNETFDFQCGKCPTVVPQVELMAQAAQVVKNARTFKLTLWPLHSSPNKNLHARPTTHSTDVIPFTPILGMDGMDGICLPMIKPQIELANALAGLPMISISSAADGNSEINALSAHMEKTSFFARPVATQESSLPSLPVQERSRSGDRSHRGNGLRKWHIEPAAGKRY